MGDALRSELKSSTAPRKRAYRAAVGATVSVVCLLATGCGGSEAIPVAAPEVQVDLSRLDVGNYPSKPVPLGMAKTDDEAALVEARRIAEVMPLPIDIDPALNFTNRFNQSRTFTDVSQYPLSRDLLMSREDFNTFAPGFISGYYTEGRTNFNTNLSWSLNNYTLLFTDAEAAKKAVGALGAKHQEILGVNYEGTRLARFPESHAVWTPRADAIYVWHSVDKFLVLTIIRDTLSDQIGSDDLPGMQARAEKVIAAIQPRLSKFTPTPRDKWGTLDRDVDGMLAITVPATNDSVTNSATIPTAYQKYGALQVSLNITEDQKLFDETGVDVAAFNGGELYRTKNADSAQLFEKRRGERGRMFIVAPSPPGLPSAKCHENREKFRGTNPRYYCTISFGRYAAEISANQLTDAHQRISAQYSLLANSK
ncbi:hypothetical protein [Nocardia sp. NPDC058480]|uniref:DUF7373 family lipoprotein n=1 Tax=unclassified Nocardia TaxID=2637762 RepID=UPI00364ECB8C